MPTRRYHKNLRKLKAASPALRTREGLGNAAEPCSSIKLEQRTTETNPIKKIGDQNRTRSNGNTLKEKRPKKISRSVKFAI